MTRWWIASLLCIAACQSDSDGFQLFCDSAELCDECRNKPMLAASEAHIQWVRDHVTSEPALEFAEALQTASTSVSGELLRRAAADAGVTSCRFADHLEDPVGLHRMWGSTD